MGWYRVCLSEEQKTIVNAERDSHPCEHVRHKMLVLWLLHCDLSRDKAAQIACLGRATAQRYVAAFRDGGLDAISRWAVKGPVSDLAAYEAVIIQSFTEQPASWVREAG